MDQDTLNKKLAGKKYARKRFDRAQSICKTHNLPCHWARFCCKCIKEGLPEIDTNRRLYIDPSIMDKLEIKIAKPKPKMKKFF